ncbi:MAG: hypothetical protein AVDCRST_MAG53-3125 [uncultured Solirubrobacteraceae bacterium]|uniref:Uncharacterized protein n=1 Tax=uncultured Solirubrobacteraceae bacterium TaxID=1162706 RepID=A0A6J4T8D0_9ACTN|nr:MAG: hypothetical protein AVDCRST_MAG53-3125 [uncultured Solirubrobacteraceae bacterium]
MKVGAPGSGQKHPPLEHQAVDSGPALQLMVRVVLLGVGHRREEHRHAALVRTVDDAPQAADDIVLLDRRLGQIPRRAALREKVVDGIDHQQRRAIRRKAGDRSPLGAIRLRTVLAHELLASFRLQQAVYPTPAIPHLSWRLTAGQLILHEQVRRARVLRRAALRAGRTARRARHHDAPRGGGAGVSRDEHDSDYGASQI